MIDVTVILLEGGLPSTSLAPLEIFSCAGTLWGMLVGAAGQPRFRVRTATIDGRSTSNYVPVQFEPNVALHDVGHTDLIIVPTAGMQIQSTLSANSGVVSWLAERGRNPEVCVAGVCTGVTLLAGAGLLEGRSATTHWAILEHCRRHYPNVRWQPDRLLTQDANIYCSGGVYASIDLSLHLVERFCGHEVAVQTAKSLLLEMPRTSQAVYRATPQQPELDDPEVQRAQAWLLANYKQPVQLDELARQVGMSPRHFARRFKAALGEAPLAHLHRLRIDAARQHLENSTRSVQEICVAVGYEDIAFFRRLFQRHLGVSPREYRARFGPRSLQSL